jgi:hypothetical protein
MGLTKIDLACNAARYPYYSSQRLARGKPEGPVYCIGRMRIAPES